MPYACSAVALGYYLPTIGNYISVFSVLFLEVWYILVARRLLQLRQAGLPAAWNLEQDDG